MRQINIPKLRQPSGLDREIYFPDWKCFCCEDKGYVESHLLAKTMCPGYSTATHPYVACERCLINKGVAAHAKHFLSRADCDELHEYRRNTWLEHVERQKASLQARREAEEMQKKVRDFSQNFGGF